MRHCCAECGLEIPLQTMDVKVDDLHYHVECYNPEEHEPEVYFTRNIGPGHPDYKHGLGDFTQVQVIEYSHATGLEEVLYQYYGPWAKWRAGEKKRFLKAGGF